MDRFKELSAFVHAAQRGSLTLAARIEGVTPAVISRRLDGLEQRLGVKLLLRSTRRVSLTFEGAAFFEDAQRILVELADSEAAVSLGGIKASGHIRISAPAGFGRRHVAPLVTQFVEEHPEVSVRLDLSDRMVDLQNEGVDLAIRIGELNDSSLVSIRLASMRRAVVASPSYVERYGAPELPEQLRDHRCLGLTQQRGWTLLERPGGSVVTIRPEGPITSNDGAVLRDWALAGQGLAWRSIWEIGDDIAAGRLVEVLRDCAAPPVGVYAVFPQRRFLPLRVRLFVDAIKHHFATPIWQPR
ncbi:LysR family transcriptional regulator [Niveibacterium sp.]|uniref:LysR family transcriptional regulator n=1 Tax=Niveibacterium sp. TaxID=2017444 RepID=UPI0035B00D2A